MKKVKLITVLTTLLLIIASIFNFGLSSFISGASLDVSIKDAPRVVCYTDDQKFTTIEKALEFATNKENINVANTIYVIPGTNPTITKNCTIDEKDTLCLPYDVETWDFREGPSALRNRFADDCAAMVAANRKSLVTIKRGVTLTINGTLQIGGILGNASVGHQGLQGQTSGSYAEILMESGNSSLQGAKIQVSANGSIDCRGYIKETEISDNPNIQPQLILNASSNLQLPFVIYDFQGANATGGIFLGNDSISALQIGQTITKDGYACPFNLFDFPNIQVSTKIISGAKVVGLVSLHTTATKVAGFIEFKESWNNDSFVVVGGENSLITIKSGYITVRYKPANLGYTEVIYYPESNTRTTVEFFGDCSFGSLQMKLNAQIATVQINTSKVLFPFSYRRAFRIKNGGKVNVNNGIKFMNGCSLEVENGGTLELLSGAKVIFYNNDWTDHKTTIPYIPTYSKYGTTEVVDLTTLDTTTTLGVTNLNPLITGNAELINNGNIKANPSSAFGGLINTMISDAKLEIGEITNQVSSLETNGQGAVDGTSYKFSQKDPQYIKENGKANIAENIDGANQTIKEIEINSKYKSKDTYFYKLEEIVYTIKITSDQNNNTSDAGKPKTYNLTATLNSTEGLTNITYHWTSDRDGYFDNNTSHTTTSGSSNKVTYTTPKNNNETDLDYHVTCYASFTKNGVNDVTQPDTMTFTAAGCLTENSLVMLANGDYKKAIDVRAGDLLMTINHENGHFEAAPVVFNDDYNKEADDYNVITLEFSNGKTVEVVYEHGFFDLDTMKYEYIKESNYKSFIGHKFVTVEQNATGLEKGEATLIRASLSNKHLRICSPVTYKNLDIITDGMLSMPGGITGIFNIFDYDSDLSYNAEKKQKDIEKYGLFDYSHFEDRIPYEFYEAFNGQYLKVAIGKGMLTEEMIDHYIDIYLPISSEQNAGT